MAEYIAIGDIHGCDDLLVRLLAQLPNEGTLIFLGDYIDRGPDTRAVIGRLLALAGERPCVFLRGNHEAMALAALSGDAEARRHWLSNGGTRTVESYGGRLPDEHMAFLERTAPFHRIPDYVFVHAGLVDGKQPEETASDSLWWMREPFLSSDYDWGVTVVHGHTPTRNRKPEVRQHRINIDTGAVYGGSLTALLLPERVLVSERARKW